MVEAESVEKEAPLPVREWYPRQKYSAIPQQNTQPQMMQPPASSYHQPAQQQTWSGGYQAYQAPPEQGWSGGYQVYQAPPVIVVQPQTPWYGPGAVQAPAQQLAAPQQQYVYPYSYQAPQRPWGDIPQSSQGTQQRYTVPSMDTQQANPWSVPAPGAQVYPGWGSPYGGYPGTMTPGYVW